MDIRMEPFIGSAPGRRLRARETTRAHMRRGNDRAERKRTIERVIPLPLTTKGFVLIDFSDF